jgi:hypothetical protein
MSTGGIEDMLMNRSNRALNRVVVAGALALGAALAQAEPIKPERFALLGQEQVTQACVAAMNLRGDQAMRNVDGTKVERLAGLRQYMFARQVWMLDAKADDALLQHWTRSFASQDAAQRSAESSYCFAAAAARVDAMPERDVRRLRVESHDTAQTMWARHQAATRTRDQRVGALTR